MDYHLRQKKLLQKMQKVKIVQGNYNILKAFKI